MADPNATRSVYSNYTLPSTAANTRRDVSTKTAVPAKLEPWQKHNPAYSDHPDYVPAPVDPYQAAIEAAYANYAKSPNYDPSKLGEPAPTPVDPHAAAIEAAYASYGKSPTFVAAGYDQEKMAREANKLKVYTPYEIAAAQDHLIFGDPPPNGWSKDPYELMMQRQQRLQERQKSIPPFDPSLGLTPYDFYRTTGARGPSAESLGLTASDIPGLPPAGVVSKVWWPGITPEMRSYYEGRQVSAVSQEHADALRDPFTWVANNINWDNPRTAANQIAWLRARENPASTDPAKQGTLPPHQRAWSVLYPTDPAKLANASPAYRTVVLANQILDRGGDSWSLNETGLTPGQIANSIAGKLMGAGITDISQFGPVPGGGIGNRVTGQRISETGLLGNTPSGNTQYGVSLGSNGQLQFVAQTKPESSGGILGDLAPIVGLGLAIFAPGIGTAIGTALGATGVAATVIGSAIVQGTLAEASGKDFADGAIKGAISAGVAPAVSATIGSTVANAMADSAFKNIVTNAVTSSATSAITAGISGADVGQAALTGALAGAGSAAGQELGISAKYGTDAFSDQTKALLAQEQGLGGASQIGGNLGVAVGKIAAGGDAEQILTSTLINTVTQGITDTLKTTVSDALKKPSAIVADSGEQDQGIEVPGSSDLLDIINGPSTQVADTDDDAALKAIEDLRPPQTDTTVDDALLGLSSPEVGEGEQAAIDEALKQEPSAPVDDGQGSSANTNIPTQNEAPITDGLVDEEVEPTSPKPPEVIVIPDEDGNQLVLDQNGNLVDIIPPETDSEQPVDTSSPETPVTDEPVDENPPFQGPMGPLTEDKIKRYNEEFARYLDFLQAGEPPPPDYGVQDLGITDENWDSFNQNLKQMTDEGRLPSQWQADEEGNYTYVDDDGSTLTIGPDGEIVHYTEAPMGNLPGETPTTTPTTTPVTTTPVTTTPVTTTPATKTNSEFDLASFLALLGGGQRKAPRAEDTTSEDPYVTFDWTKPLQTNPFASQGEAPKMAEGGSIDELLDMLQYRG